MKIGEILQRDPATYGLVNQGQARITDRKGEKELQELRGELSTFVCEGQFADGIQKILRSFLDNLNRTSQKGAWVSGFYGSGKSHILKMACHLWQNTTFPDGATARTLVPHIPDEIQALLRELDIAGRRAGGLLGAAGAMPSGSNDNVRLTILSIILRAVGLPSTPIRRPGCAFGCVRTGGSRLSKSRLPPRARHSTERSTTCTSAL